MENDLHLAAHVAHLMTIVFQDIFAVIEHFPAGCFNESQNRSSKRAFTTAGLANNAKRLTRIYFQADIVDSVQLSDGAATITGRACVEILYRTFSDTALPERMASTVSVLMHFFGAWKGL